MTAPNSRNPADDDSLIGAFKIIQRKMRQNIDGMLPAMVISHDRAKGTVRLKPLITMINTLGEIVERGEIPNIPVLKLGGGGFFVDFNLPKGSLGWIEASDRDISIFRQSFAESQPNSRRMQSFSDARFIPDVMTGYTIASEDSEAMVIQNLSGSVKIALDENQIRVINSSVRIEISDNSVTGTAPGGFNLNGATIDSNGAIVSPVSVSAPSIVADGKELAGHTHTITSGSSAGTTSGNN